MAKKKKKKAKRSNPLAKIKYQVSDQLYEITGKRTIKGTEVVSLLWKYFKKHGLNEGQKIYLDDNLKAVYGEKKSITMFQVNSKEMRDNNLRRVE